MRKYILFTIMFISFNLYADYIDINNFSGGLYNSYTPSSIPDVYSPDLQNIYIDRDNSLVKRNGYSKYNTTSINNSAINYLFDYNNGISYMIAITSHNVLYSQNGTFTEIANQLQPVSWSGLTWLNTFIANSITKSFSWDGINYTDLTATTPQSEISILYGDRMWVASATGNKSILYYSALFDYNNWDTINDFEYVGKDDGDVVTGMWVQNGNLMISKKNSIWKFVGTDPTTASGLEKQLVTTEFGCIDRGSIKEFGQGRYMFMSYKGLCVTDGFSVVLVSVNIQPTINNMTQLTSSKDYWLTTSKQDWNQGTLIGFDSTTISGSIKVSTSSRNEMIVSGLSSPGISSSYNGNIYNTIVKFDTNNTIHAFSNILTDFYYYTYTINSSSWSLKFVESTWSIVGMDLDSLNNPHFVYKTVDHNGTYTFGYSSFNANNIIFSSTFIPTGFVFNVVDCNAIKMILDNKSNPIVLFNYGENLVVSTKTSYGWSNLSITTSAQSNQSYNSDIAVDTNNHICVAYSGLDVTDAVYKLYISTYHSVLSKFVSTNVYIMNPQTEAITDVKLKCYKNIEYIAINTNGNDRIVFASATYNSPFSLKKDIPNSTEYQHIALNINKSNENIFIAHQNKLSYYNTDWNLNVTVSTITVIAPYLDFKNNTPYIGYFTVPNYATSSTQFLLYSNVNVFKYISPMKYANDNWNKWDLFYSTGSNYENTINYRLNVSTFNGGSNFTPIYNNTIINLTTGQYIQYEINLRNVNSLSSTTISDVLIYWFNGNEFKPMSSAIYDNRYWLSYGTSTINTNVLVMTPDYRFTNFNGINSNSMLVYKNSLYTGSSVNNGYIYKQDTGWNDDGQPIDAYYWTKAFNLGNFIDKKSITNIYTVAQATTSILSCSYVIDESTTAINYTVPLSSSPLSGIVVIKKGMSYNTKGNYIKFKLGNNQLDKEFNIKGIRCEYTPEPTQ